MFLDWIDRPILFLIVGLIQNILRVVLRNFFNNFLDLILLRQIFIFCLNATACSTTIRVVPVFKLALEDPVVTILIKLVVRRFQGERHIWLRITVIRSRIALPNQMNVIFSCSAHNIWTNIYIFYQILVLLISSLFLIESCGERCWCTISVPATPSPCHMVGVLLWLVLKFTIYD